MTTPSDHPELTCKELVELVTDYLEGELAKADRRRFERHLSGCPGCATHLEQMHDTIQTLGTLPEESLTPQAQDELLTAFRGWRGGKSGA